MIKTAVQTDKSIRPAMKHAEIYSVADAPVARGYHPFMPAQEFSVPHPSRSYDSGTGAIGMAVLVLVLTAATYAWAAMHDLLLLKIAAVVAAPLCIFAVWRGGLRKTVVLGTMIGLSMLWANYPDLPAGVISSIAGQSSPIAAAIASSVLAGLVVFIAGFMAKSMRKRLVGGSRIRGILDRFAGLSIGVGETMLVVLTLCWTAESLDGMARRIVDDSQVEHAGLQYQVAEAMTQIGDETKRSGWSRFVRDTNPITKTPALQKLIDQLNETGRLDFDATTLQSLLPTASGQSAPEATPALLENLIQEQKHAAEKRVQTYDQLEQSMPR
jgi:hypothetical protein